MHYDFDGRVALVTGAGGVVRPSSQGTVGTPRDHWKIVRTEQGQDSQRVLRAVIDTAVAGNVGDGEHVQFARAQREDDPKRVVHPRVHVEDDFLWHPASPVARGTAPNVKAHCASGTTMIQCTRHMPNRDIERRHI